jgi:hypothetical protein
MVKKQFSAWFAKPLQVYSAGMNHTPHIRILENMTYIIAGPICDIIKKYLTLFTIERCTNLSLETSPRLSEVVLLS